MPLLFGVPSYLRMQSVTLYWTILIILDSFGAFIAWSSFFSCAINLGEFHPHLMIDKEIIWVVSFSIWRKRDKINTDIYFISVKIKEKTLDLIMYIRRLLHSRMYTIWYFNEYYLCILLYSNSLCVFQLNVCILLHNNSLCVLQQYFFSTKVIEFVGELIHRQDVDRVLCIGTPTIHEHVKHNSQLSSIRSLLLDIDIRLVSCSE